MLIRFLTPFIPALMLALAIPEGAHWLLYAGTLTPAALIGAVWAYVQRNGPRHC